MIGKIIALITGFGMGFIFGTLLGRILIQEIINKLFGGL